MTHNPTYLIHPLIFSPHTILSIFSRIILEKAKATRRLFMLVQTHDDSFDVTAFAEQLVQLETETEDRND